MAALSDYVSGTISLTNGSVDFTGTGTAWQLAQIGEGDTIFYLPGTAYQGVISEITTNVAGKLDRAWEGPDLTDVAYRIRFLPDGVRSTSQSAMLREQLGNGNIQAVAGLTGSADQVIMFTGPGAMATVPKSSLVSGVDYDVQVDDLAARAAYDGQAAGFSVLVSDIGDGRSAIYSKATNSSGDWTDPAYVTGPASTVPGPVGVNWRGTYDNGTTYGINDGAYFNGSSFRKLTNSAAGTAPSGANPPVDNTNWAVIAARSDGANGSNGVDGTGLFSRVRVVSTTNITISTALNNGDTIDGVVLATNDLVLVSGQSAPADNGVYVVGVTPARDSTFDTYDEHPGVYVSVMEGTANADTLWRCTSNKGGTLGTTAIVFSQFSSGGSASGGDISNLGLAFSVASSALTIALKQADGSTDPAIGAGAVKAKMRSTAASGAVIERSATAAASLVIPSTATMGRTNGLNGHLYHYLIDNAGTLELAVSGKYFGRSGIISTTAMTTASDSYDVMYSTTARSNVPYLLVGRSIDTQTTAGTWAATPSSVDIAPLDPFDVGFFAYMSAGQSVANNTASKLALNTEEFDTGSFFDTSNNRWTPPAGRYTVIGAARLATSGDQAAFWITLYKNGSAYKELDFTQMSGTGDQKVTGSLMIEANGADYFELYCQHNIGANRTIYGSAQYTSLQGFRIAA